MPRIPATASKAFGKLYRDAVKVAPDNQSSWTYDAITVLSQGDQQGRLDRPGKDPRGDPGDQEIPGRRGRI